MNESPRVVATLAGNPAEDPGARTKYGLLFKAVAQQLPLVNIYDARLQSVDRMWNALTSFHPDRSRWQERFYKNPVAFRRRSQRLARHLHTAGDQADVVLQVGVLFDSTWPPCTLPVVIYTDYTAALSARKPEAGRSPLRSRAQEQWLALERQAYRRAAHICVRSQLVQCSLIADYNLPPEQVSVVGGGVNFDPLPESVILGVNDTPPALFIGKDFQRKGGALLLAAFALARRQCPQARLLLVTAGPLPQPLPPGVEMIAPTWDRAAIAALYRQAGFFVLPSRLETWGDVLLEAMAFGLPCIGVDDDAMGEIILPEETGLLVPPGDAGALADALVRLYSHPELRRRWGAAGRQRVQEQFLWSQVAERMAISLEAAAAGTNHLSNQLHSNI